MIRFARHYLRLMTDEDHREAILQRIKRVTAENTKTKEAASAYLVRAGFLTAAGKLKPEYGG